MATVSLVLAIPVAADLDLIGGDDAQVAYTNGDGVTLRAAAGTGADVLAGLPEGTVVAIDDGPIAIEDGSSWYAVSVEMAEGWASGWVDADYLTSASSSYTGAPTGGADDAASGVPVAVYSGGGLSLRANPWTDAEVIMSIPDGALVDVLLPASYDDNGIAWSEIRYDGAVGYADSSYLGSAIVTPTEPVVELVSTSGAVTIGGFAMVVGTGGEGVNVRDAPAIDSAVVTSLFEGAVIEVVDGPATDDVGDAWYQVNVAGTLGWVYGGYLAGTDAGGADLAVYGAATTGDAFIAAARDYLGVPYVWGGSDPDGFDCSGFTYFIINQVLGNDFPRPMEGQVASGYEVSPENLIPGDVIFFQNTYQWGISHVGFYLGDGQFISATGEHSAVGISNLNDPYWAARYLSARRMY